MPANFGAGRPQAQGEVSSWDRSPVARPIRGVCSVKGREDHLAHFTREHGRARGRVADFHQGPRLVGEGHLGQIPGPEPGRGEGLGPAPVVVLAGFGIIEGAWGLVDAPEPARSASSATSVGVSPELRIRAAKAGEWSYAWAARAMARARGLGLGNRPRGRTGIHFGARLEPWEPPRLRAGPRRLPCRRAARSG